MKKYFSLVKFSHTVFALPFALVGFMLGINEADYSFSWDILIYILLCMVFARNSAMAFNRYLDRDIDAKNPRTAVREIPSGQITAQSALIFVLINSSLFILSAAMINMLCFYLSPVALAVILGYSYTKRFTWLCHFVLGLGLGLAPIGAYIAVTASFSFLPLILGFAVLSWTAGFDMIYALQDIDFDTKEKLHSVPVKMGAKRALTFSMSGHFVSGIVLLLFCYLSAEFYPELDWTIWVGGIFFVTLLFYQHTLVRPDDLSKVNLAFFTTNGIASILFGGSVFLDFYVI